MRQAITTRFVAPTNRRGARVKASADAGSIFVPWDYSLGASGNHIAAARALAHQLAWPGVWFGGTLPNQDSVFVLGLDEAFSINVSIEGHA